MTELENNLTQILSEKSTKIIPENIKKGVTIFNVTGTAETSAAGVKLFKTEEEMQADSEATEGDLAVVYRSEIKNATVDSKFQVATFPDTVVLDTAMTGNVQVRYRAVDSSKMFDCWGRLNSSSFMMNCYTDSGRIRIEYRSSDGITYTRTRMQGDSGNLENPVDFGTEIYYEMAEMWNDAIGKFIQVGGNIFEGLYKYESQPNENYITSFTNFQNTGSAVTATAKDIAWPKIKTLMEKILVENSLYYMQGTVVINQNNAVLYTLDYSTTKLYSYLCDIAIDDTQGYILHSNPATNTILSGIKKLVLDLDNQTYTVSTLTHSSKIYDIEYGDTFPLSSTLFFVDVRKDVMFYSYTRAYYSSGFLYTRLQSKIGSKVMYYFAPTQLTVKNINELLPGKIAYGNNGVVMGDETIYDNLDMSLTTKHLLPGIPTDSTSDHIITFDNRYVRKNK